MFKHIAWLFDRQIYHYISAPGRANLESAWLNQERQTARFPFIEDLDIQVTALLAVLASTSEADLNYPGASELEKKKYPDGEWRPPPPDWLIMQTPEQVGINGDPGLLMKKRAKCLLELNFACLSRPRPRYEASLLSI